MDSDMDYASIKPVFKQVAVDRALLIDDAYDPAPDLDVDDLQKGFRLVEAKAEIEQAYRDAGGAWPVDFTAFSGAVSTDGPVRTLMLGGLDAERKSPQYVLANAIYGQRQREHAAKRLPLDALSAVLRELDIEPAELGSKATAKGSKYPLIFLDYYLGEEGLPSVERSVEKIRSILESDDYQDAEMPLVVLMSSVPPNGEAVDSFRRQAGLLGCQFVFVGKDKFTAAAFEIVSTLADRAAFLPQTRAMSRFIKAWKVSMERAVSAVADDTATLDLQDFYFIWRKAGEGRNMRFGDHISSLFEGLLRKQIEDDTSFQDATAAIADLSFGKMPPSPMVPSPTVARLAHASAFRDLEPFPDDYTTPPKALGVDLGELFIAESRRGKPRQRRLDALMVISQACDLEHGNVGTILMVEGTVVERTAATRASSAAPHRRLRVDIFQFHNERGEMEDLIIEWDAQRMKAYPVATFHADMRAGKYERVGRLRPLHALALQQKFASQLTRVGMPDTLPVYRYGALEVRIATPKGSDATTKILLTTSAPNRGVCVVGEEDKHVIVMASELELIRAALDHADPKDFAEGAIEKLRAELSDLKNFRDLLQVDLGKKASLQVGSVEVRDAELPVPKDYKLARNVLATFSFV
jgi:hypothetical protein